MQAANTFPAHLIEDSLMAKPVRAPAPPAKTINWGLVVSVLSIVLSFAGTGFGVAYYLGGKANAVQTEVAGFRTEVAGLRLDFQRRVETDMKRDDLGQLLIESQIEIIKIIRNYYTPTQRNRQLDRMTVKLENKKVSKAEFTDHAYDYGPN